MRIKDYQLQELLIGYDTLKGIIDAHGSESNSYKEKEIARTSCWCFFGVFLAGLSVALTNLHTMWIIIPFGIVAVIFLALSVYNAAKWHDKSKELKKTGEIIPLDVIIENHIREDMMYTGVMRIVNIDDEKTYYLVGNDFFLPHCVLNPENEIDNQIYNIKESLKNHYKIRSNDILRIIPIDNTVHYSIKPVHNKLQLNAFVFYDIEIKEQVKDELTEIGKDYKWISLNQMKESASAMSTNKDVITLLENFPAPTDSFVNTLGNIKIIWNITKRCPYNCAICATHDDERKELSPSEKLEVMNSIFTARSSIKSLDFAGGDPLHDIDSVNIIRASAAALGNDRISITTTGKGLSNSEIKLDNLKNITQCEITIDAAHKNLSTRDGDNIFSRKEAGYSDSNIESISLVSEWANSIVVNIPIINDDLSDSEIDILLEKIQQIKKHVRIKVSASLIRLMPVGKANMSISLGEYSNYNPLNVVERIRTRLEENEIPCKLHCSLRVLPYFNECRECHCNMLEEKIGIDCAGNVFACAWGAYLPKVVSPHDNPFYLGNLTESTLSELLSGKNKTNSYRKINSEIDSENYRQFCSVVSYYMSDNLFEDFDPLSVIRSEGDLYE